MTDKKIVTANTNFMRLMNQSLVLDLIRSRETISRADIAKRLKLSKSTVSALVEDLVKSNYVVETGAGSSTSDGGRKPTQLAFNPKAGYVVGVELGGHQSLLLITDLAGTIVHKDKIGVAAVGDQAVTKLLAFVGNSVSASGIAFEDIVGFGVAVPGICDIHNRIILQAPVLNWSDVPLWDLFENEFNKPVYIDNDVNLAAMGERWIGAGRGVDNLLMVSFGAGVGAGIITDGKLCRGHRYSAGEIGYFFDSRDWEEGVVNEFLEFGTYEKRTSLHAVRRLLRLELADADASGAVPLQLLGQDLGSLTYDDVAKAAAEGDGAAKKVLDTVITYMALGIANMASMLNPEMIIVGGEIDKAGAYMIDRMQQKLKQMIPIPFHLRLSTLKKEAEALGAVAVVLEDLNRLLLTKN